MSLSLTPNSHGGMDTYLGKFEELSQELALHGDPLSEAQKITMFLNGIKDRKYTHLKTLCRTENYSYEKVLLEFRRESQELDTPDKNSPTRNVKNKSTRRSTPKSKEKKDSAKVPNDYRLPPNVWKTLTRKQQDMYKKALKMSGRSSADFVEEPQVSDDNVPRRMHSKKTSAFDSVDQLQKPQDKIGEEAGDIWKPKPRSISIKKSERHDHNTYAPKAKTTSKDPEDPVLTSEKPEKRDFSKISEKGDEIEKFEIPKKPRITPPFSLAEYIKRTKPNFKSQPSICTQHIRKRNTYMHINNPPKWILKPVLADEFCLYEDEEDIHISHVTIYDPDLGCIFNLTVDQAMRLKNLRYLKSLGSLLHSH